MNVQLKDRPKTENLPNRRQPVRVDKPSAQAPLHAPQGLSRRRMIIGATAVVAIVAGLAVLAISTGTTSSDDVTPAGVVAATPDHFSPGGNSLAPSRPAATRAVPADYFTPGGNSLSDGSR